jgi:hypothetical protein
MKFIDNDSIALIILGVMGISSVILSTDIAVTTGIIGAIGGFIGAVNLKK